MSTSTSISPSWVTLGKSHFLPQCLCLCPEQRLCGVPSSVCRRSSIGCWAWTRRLWGPFPPLQLCTVSLSEHNWRQTAVPGAAIAPGFHKHEEASSTCAEGSAQPGLPRQHSPTELPFRQHWCISSTPDWETSTRAEEIWYGRWVLGSWTIQISNLCEPSFPYSWTLHSWLDWLISSSLFCTSTPFSFFLPFFPPCFSVIVPWRGLFLSQRAFS